MAHRFRFFIAAGEVQPGDVVNLAPADGAHIRVLRLSVGDEVEVADSSRTVWSATLTDIDSGRVCIDAHVTDNVMSQRPMIELLAGVLIGGRFDQLVDGAVQAGVDRIVPVARSRRDLERIGGRIERLQRICEAAAKQAKRTVIPVIASPTLEADEALWQASGIVLDASADLMLRDVAAMGGDVVRVYVGAADGIDADTLERLVARGWVKAKLGTPILRSELAAAVTVAAVRAANCVSK